MKRVALVAAAGCIAFALVLVLGPRLLRDPEISNPYDEIDAGVIVLEPPRFLVSDPQLSNVAPYTISERIVEAGTDAGMEGAPYLIELDDGRFVFGYTDDGGNTRPIYTRRPGSHTTYWYDDALAKLNSLQASLDNARGAVQQGVATDGASPRR